MNIRLSYLVWMVVLAAVVVLPSRAQFPEDALRLSTPGIGVGIRALGMGNAYAAIANDYSAVYWNPAGLAQMRFGEFAFGMTYTRMSNEATFFNSTSNATASGTYLNALGIVMPFPVQRGSFVVAFGFHRDNSFLSDLRYNGFNTQSSYVQVSAPNGESAPTFLDDNLAYQLWLADVDSSGRWFSPITSRVTQAVDVLEKGGTDNWSVAGAMDIARNFSAGVTVTYLSGSYSYTRQIDEQDTENRYQNRPYDYARLLATEYDDSDISGVTARFGVHYRGDFVRLGIAVKAPTAYTVKENHGISTAFSTFDDSRTEPAGPPFSTRYYNEYDVVTPWAFNAGLALTFGEALVLSGSAEYTDWATMEFDDAAAEITEMNQDIRSIFTETVNLRVGAELQIPWTEIRLRAGAMYLPSPYKDDPSWYDRKIITGGVGMLFGGSVMLDLAYSYGWWESFRANDPVSTVGEVVTQQNIMLGISYRF